MKLLPVSGMYSGVFNTINQGWVHTRFYCMRAGCVASIKINADVKILAKCSNVIEKTQRSDIPLRKLNYFMKTTFFLNSK